MEIKTRKESKAMIVTPNGRMDAISSPEVEKTVVDIISKGEKFIILNMENIDYISSAGLRVVLTIAKNSKTAGGEAYITGLRPSVEEIFKLTGFQNLLKIFANDEEALSKL